MISLLVIQILFDYTVQQHELVQLGDVVQFVFGVAGIKEQNFVHASQKLVELGRENIGRQGMSTAVTRTLARINKVIAANFIFVSGIKITL